MNTRLLKKGALAHRAVVHHTLYIMHEAQRLILATKVQHGFRKFEKVHICA